MILDDGNYTVYIHTNKANGKRYVGITCKNPKKRWENGSGYTDSPKFWNAIKKYGWENFDHEIIASGLNKDEACHMERFLIKELDTQRNGYNIFEGGQAPKQTPESIEKTRQANLGRKLSDETRKRISESKTGEKHPNYGKHLKAETKEKIGNANRGRKASEETKRKLSESHMGYRPQCGRKATPVMCIETGIVYSTLHEAYRDTGIPFACIRNVCKGWQKTAGKLHWRYV